MNVIGKLCVSSKFMQYECPYCNTQLEISADDAIEVIQWPYHAFRATFICCECGRKINLYGNGYSKLSPAMEYDLCELVGKRPIEVKKHKFWLF